MNTFHLIAFVLTSLTKRLVRIELKKKKNTEYQGGIKISYFDEVIVSQLLWEQIWAKKLFINFSKNPYFVQTNKIVFVVKR